MQRLFCRTPQSWHNDQTPRVRHEDPRHRRSKYDTHNLVRTRLYEFSYSGSRTIMQYKIVVAVIPCEHNLFVSSNLFGQSSNYYYHNFQSIEYHILFYALQQMTVNHIRSIRY